MFNVQHTEALTQTPYAFEFEHIIYTYTENYVKNFLQITKCMEIQAEIILRVYIVQILKKI